MEAEQAERLWDLVNKCQALDKEKDAIQLEVFKSGLEEGRRKALVAMIEREFTEQKREYQQRIEEF